MRLDCHFLKCKHARIFFTCWLKLGSNKYKVHTNIKNINLPLLYPLSLCSPLSVSLFLYIASIFPQDCVSPTCLPGIGAPSCTFFFKVFSKVCSFTLGRLPPCLCSLFHVRQFTFNRLSCSALFPSHCSQEALSGDIWKLLPVTGSIWTYKWCLIEILLIINNIWSLFAEFKFN